MAKAAISVVIPVYNVPEAFFRKCLDSVCGQTLRDLEIVCVDDASTDGSLAVLREYAARDPRVRIIEFAENRGAAAARNAGIDAAGGEYIGFVDADDSIDSDFYEKLYAAALAAGGADAAKGEIVQVDGEGKPIDDPFYDINAKARRHKAHFCHSFTSAIYRAAALLRHGIRFPEGITHFEDPYFSIAFALAADNVEIVDGARYRYVRHGGSATGRPQTAAHARGMLEVQEKLLDMLDDARADDAHYAIAADFFLETASGYHDSEAFGFVLEGLGKIARKIQNRKGISEPEHLPKTARKIAEFGLEGFRLVLESHGILARQPISMVSAVNDFGLYNRLVAGNKFVEGNPFITLAPLDNRADNQPIAKRYNQFLDSFDYSRPAWLVFCHSDWEVLEDIAPKLALLDKSCLWGPIGTIASVHGNICRRHPKGKVFQRRRDGSRLCILSFGRNDIGEAVDTFDCQCLIVHSSLVEKHGLRFDERLYWDLYVEDFCLQAWLKNGARSLIAPISCCHWSDTGFTAILPKSYEKALAYMNEKYDGMLLGGCCSIIGRIDGVSECNDLKSVLKAIRSRIIQDKIPA